MLTRYTISHANLAYTRKNKFNYIVFAFLSCRSSFGPQQLPLYKKGRWILMVLICSIFVWVVGDLTLDRKKKRQGETGFGETLLNTFIMKAWEAWNTLISCSYKMPLIYLYICYYFCFKGRGNYKASFHGLNAKDL